MREATKHHLAVALLKTSITLGMKRLRLCIFQWNTYYLGSLASILGRALLVPRHVSPYSLFHTVGVSTGGGNVQRYRQSRPEMLAMTIESRVAGLLYAPS